MSVASLTSSGAMASLPLKVRYTTLLKYMGFAPFAMLLVIIDQLFLDGTLKQAMMLRDDQMITLMAVLTFPHIIASLISFADREYCSYYKKPLLKGIIVSVGLALVSKYILGGHAILVTVAFYSLYHNVMQQFGISSMIMRNKPNLTYTAMKWLMVIPSCLAYAVVTFPFFPGLAEYHELYMKLVGLSFGTATILATIYYIQIRHNPDIPKIGLWYFGSNVIWMLVSYAMVVGGYASLAILVSRVVHDFTAYRIYTVHDQNRNSETIFNWFYYLPKKIGIQPVYLLLPVSIAISLFMLAIEDHGDLMAIIIGSFNAMHYFIEGYTWKRGTPHRLYTPFE